MNTALVLFLGLVALGTAARAEVDPVAVHVPEAKAWVGQRVPFFVELRARGSFAGTASFDLPQIPGSLLMKIGSPVVSSQDLEGQSWFVQTHEFALFSQKAGPLEVPAFSVRFASRDGFTGPARDVQAQVPRWTVAIERPPGSDRIGFLITTESLDVTETWEPQPAPAQVGALFKRTIVQRAPQLSGMALAPASTTAPDGIRVYRGDAETKDRLERGDFLGERRETITYLLQNAGTFALPALTYVWWNPTTEQLQSKTLPFVTFDVAPVPAALAPGEWVTARAWQWLLAASLIVGLIAWQRQRIAAWGKQSWKTLNPPDRAAARRLLRACRHHDAAAAETAWTAWQSTQDAAFQPAPELRGAVLGLQRHLFGPTRSATWQADELTRAFKAHLAAANALRGRKRPSVLPLLNPR